jgi:hypothetical protein
MVFNTTFNNNISSILLQSVLLVEEIGVSVQSVFITTNVVSLNPAYGEVYWIHHYVIKFVNDLRQVNGFFLVLLFPQPIKLTATQGGCL